MNLSHIAQQIAAVVMRRYGFDDTADLAFTLLESGVIDPQWNLNRAASVVAQHVEQA